MANYILPQVLVFQDFRLLPAETRVQLSAHISGPHAYLVRFSEPNEREAGNLGWYDRLTDTDYSWPGQPLGSRIDLGYTKVFVRDALLRYYENIMSAGDAITKVGPNRIQANTTVFASSTAAPRSPDFLDRDVQPGDVVRIRGVDTASNSHVLWTTVQRVIGVPVASSVSSATADTHNAATTTLASTINKIGGPDNCVTAAVNASGYNGLPSGHVSETYTIIVTDSSTGGNFTTARLRVISGSGTDSQINVIPAAAGSPTNIGTRGLKVTFDKNITAACQAAATAAGVTEDDLIAGQRWQVTVTQAFTPPTATSGGTYTHTLDTTYIVEVSRGGLFTSTVKPQITVTTHNGSDFSGPTDVPAAATAVPIGTRGLTISFAGTALRKGDRYYITAIGTQSGPRRIIELAHNLPAAIPNAADLDVSLFIRRPVLELSEKALVAPNRNWQAFADKLTVYSGITVQDPSWTSGGVPQPLPLFAEPSQNFGRLYVQYRAYLSNLSNTIGTVYDIGQLDDQISGPLDPDNPLKWAVFKALQNANTAGVRYTAVADPDDLNSWSQVLGLLVREEGVYGLVPLTQRRDIQELYVAHALSQSTPEQASWRTVWLSLKGIPTIPIIHNGSTVDGYSAPTTTDELPALGTVQDLPSSPGVYNVLRLTSGNADFLEQSIRPGDKVRINFAVDAYGEVSYQEYTVASIQSADQLTLATPLSLPVTIPVKFEIWRNLSRDEEAAAIGRQAGSWGHRRVRAVWPDHLGAGSRRQPGYFLAAALAGLSSGVAPHQGLTRLEIVGFDDLRRTTDYFSRAQLDTMAASGVWIVTQDADTGRVFTRHGLTTANYNDINQREEVLTRNVDSISFLINRRLDSYIGVSNVTPTLLSSLRIELMNLIGFLQQSINNRIGGQLIDATIVRFEQNELFRDRVDLVLDCVLPYPFNNMEVRLLI